MPASVEILSLVVACSPLLLGLYAYVAYPLMLRAMAFARPAPGFPAEPESWPFISITIPAFNEERSIAATLDNLLRIDYPSDRREILVISDASTDATDAIVSRYREQGVSLLRLPARAGKTAAENAAGAVVKGEIIVNTDASVRVATDALKPLVQVFGDPTVGVASGRDVSVGDLVAEANQGESGYVGYEMTLRAWETRVGSIIGASGCFYGFRKAVHDIQFPDALSRDFASCLIARERGYRSVSVDAARCFVPRTRSLDSEFRRKIRTMARGLSTLFYKRALLNPFRYGVFAFMLASHKLARWLVYAAVPFAAIALVALALTSRLALWVLALGVVGAILGAIGMRWRGSGRTPKPLALAAFAVSSVWAGVLAWRDALAGRRRPFWEPTRRPT